MVFIWFRCVQQQVRNPGWENPVERVIFPNIKPATWNAASVLEGSGNRSIYRTNDEIFPVFSAKIKQRWPLDIGDILRVVRLQGERTPGKGFEAAGV